MEGVSRLCVICKKTYYCTDGDYICSKECYDHYLMLEEIEMNESEEY